MVQLRPEKRWPATKADLEALPEHLKGEIIDGILYTQPRPRGAHANIELLLGSDLCNTYQRGRGGPGGWWILIEPGIELAGSPEFSPEIAGWRRGRLPVLPHETSITVVPDWICEVLSPRTRGYDQRVKRPFYARLGVGHLWFVDFEARTLSASRLEQGKWVEIGVYGDDDQVRIEPFSETEIDLAEWWMIGSPESSPTGC